MLARRPTLHLNASSLSTTYRFHAVGEDVIKRYKEFGSSVLGSSYNHYVSISLTSDDNLINPSGQVASSRLDSILGGSMSSNAHQQLECAADSIHNALDLQRISTNVGGELSSCARSTILQTLFGIISLSERRVRWVCAT